MIPIQAKIEIENGKIVFSEPTEGYTQITSGGATYTFDGCFAIAGFVDSHCHVAGLGMKLLELSLENSTSEEHCIEMCRNYPQRIGAWLIGRGWNQEAWQEKQFPRLSSLDSAFPHEPVFLIRTDGHAAWANSIALRISGIDEYTDNPPGGLIGKDNKGKLTGILLDNAMDLVRAHIPQRSAEYETQLIKAGLEECLKSGITEVHDMDVSPRHLIIYRNLDEAGLLPIRVNCNVSAQNNEWITNGVSPHYGNKLSVTGLKFFADGALGSRGAALIQEYRDRRGYHGLILAEKNELFEKIAKGVAAGWDIAAHAIGDAANRMILDIYGKLIKEGRRNEAVLRIEHSQIVHQSDISRFAELEVVPSVQPVHFTSDMFMAEERLQKDVLQYSYPWRSLIDAGSFIISGSDFPIETHNPFDGLRSLTEDPCDKQGKHWHSKETIGILEALKSYNEWPHLAFRQPRSCGKIEKGYDADFIIINNDLLNIKANEITDTKVMAVVSAGMINIL